MSISFLGGIWGEGIRFRMGYILFFYLFKNKFKIYMIYIFECFP